jgi:outer membrane receptor protein involved in Fe transport
MYHQYFRQLDETPLYGYRMAIDYTTRISKHHSLSLGLHSQHFFIEGGFRYDTLGTITEQWGAFTAFENHISLNRTIFAGYADLDGQWRKFHYRAGLRVEYTDQVLEITNPDYFTILDRKTKGLNLQQYHDWFPSIHIRYPLKKGDQLMLAVSRRISRSPVKNMAPFLYRRHTEVYVIGDPELKPEYINLAEITYNKGIGNHRLSFRGFYRGVENAVFRVNTVYPDEMVLIRSFTNSGSTRSLGGEVNAILEPGSRTRLFIGASLYDYRVKAEIFEYQEDQRSLAWSLKGNLNVTLTQSLRLAADADVRSPLVTPQGRDEMMYIANLSLGYSPVKFKGWNFTLRGLNLLNSNTRTFHTRAFDSEGIQIFYQDTEMVWMGPIAELSIKYDLNWFGETKKTDSEFGRREF